MSVVATLGLGQFLLVFALVINPDASTGITFPKPPGFPELTVGGLYISQSYTAMAVLVPLAVLALAVFLTRSRAGLGIRAAAQNPDAARLSGLSTSRMSSLSWGIAGALSALTAILVIPTQGAAAAASFGPSLLLRALAAAVLARLVSIPIAMGAGIALGVVESVVTANTSTFGFVDVVLFVVILLAVLMQAPRTGRDEERASWTTVAPFPPLPARLRALGSVKRARRIGLLVVVALLLVAPVLSSNATSFDLIVILAVAVVGLSVGIVTGLAGQLSLGQFAVAGVGAVASYQVAFHTGSFPLAFLCAGLAAAVASVLLGLPALRVRGLMLAVTTLSFALAAEEWLLRRPFTLGGGVDPGRPVVGSWAADTARRYYVVVLVVFAVAVWLAWNVRRGGFGRLLVAVRDGEQQARAFGVRAWRVKLQAYAVSGFVAGLGGAAYGHAFSTLSYSNFHTDSVGDPSSIGVVAMSVLGGIGLLIGPLLGALYIIGIPRFLPLDSAGLAASSLGWLLLLLYTPSGLAGLLRPLRERWVQRISRALPSSDSTQPADTRPAATQPLEPAEDPLASQPRPPLAVLAPRSAPTPAGSELALRVRGVHKAYGGVVALDGVDLDVRRGEVLGLLGPNGAGKTTLFEVIGGFTKPDRGSVELDGDDVTARGPELRAHRGLVRSFQDAPLFPTLSVLDTVRLAHERQSPTRLATSLVGSRRAERRKEERARELIALMGLQDWVDVPVSALSTGTRRIAELACLVALEPRVLLLDEPSSGIAQRESEALGEVLLGLKRHLDATVVVIEHDMPLLSGIADRLVAMESGTVIATGTPDEVLSSPLVVASYLGSDAVAVERSDSAGLSSPTSRAGRCRATTKSGRPCSRAAVRDGHCAQHTRQSELTPA
jgi:ABC-type branched-subunit amino acid transport system ATPase component/ABC-type branched-subunit amino acid transport system permease subunit